MVVATEPPLLTGYTRSELFVVIGKTDKSVDNSVINNGLTISMKKNVSQHSTHKRIRR